jgi:acetyltransferase
MEQLGDWLLAVPEVRALGIYAEGIERMDQLARVVARARGADKSVVLMIGGLSEAGHRAAASHSGAAASPRRVLEGLCNQFGAVLAHSLDELAWSLEVLHDHDFRRPSASEVAVFSDSGGAGITLADALEFHGVPVLEPEDRVGAGFGSSRNPFDFGSASMGDSAAQAE